MISIATLQQDAVSLLQQLITTPSFSGEEDKTAQLIKQYLEGNGIDSLQIQNNVIAKNKYFDKHKPVIVLNSHHDTVKPNVAYTLDPFNSLVLDGKLYGLGSNDAGGCLVSLIATFVYFYEQKDLPFNLVLVVSAEEEISGKNGVELLFGNDDFRSYTCYQTGDNWSAIVGEPTMFQMAIAEKGLMVIDAYAKGVAGHVAREEGENALYVAMKDVLFLTELKMEKVSPFLGPVKISVTAIETENKQHNVVPAQCHFVIDVRLNELYTPMELLDFLKSNLKSECKERSMRLRSTKIELEHPLVKTGLDLGKSYYGSPTTSDKALMPFPALKMGPGDSARSHTADEFIFIEEIEKGIVHYIELLENAKKYYE